MEVSEWYYLGPFSIGAREGIIGIDLNLNDETFALDTTKIYPSILVQGGMVKWQRICSDSDRVKIEYKDVLWDTIQDYYGAAGLLCASIVYGEFQSDSEIRGVIDAQNVGSFILNGKPYPGNIYRDDYSHIPVLLKKGKNKIILRLTGFGGHGFSFKILFPSEPVIIISKDITLPDFIKGKVDSGYIGVPIMNTTENPVENLVVKVEGENITKREKRIKRLIPFSVAKVPLQITGQVIDADSTLIKIVLVYNHTFVRESLWIKVKSPQEPFTRTFISKIDNSCQYYAVLPPKDYDPESTYGLIMTCHGAGVEARGQVGAYTQKEWAFVVAPTNRRRFGFDWQDWGRLDFLEVLEDVKKKFKIDTNMTYLAGHSMGGHGVWHIGLSHPDLFAAIAPSAGWTTFQLYIPWFLQKSEIFAQPEQIKFRDMVLREDVTPLFLNNALNLPIYILHGGLDDNVPPIQGRIMAKYLNILNYDFLYTEVSGQKHWWDIDTTLGVDCVDLKELMDFLKEKKRNPYPKKVIFKTTDIAHSNKAYWVRIDELKNLYKDAIIEAEVDTLKDSGILSFSIRTENIKRFSIFLEPKKGFYYLSFKINQNELGRIRYKGERVISFEEDGGSFDFTRWKERGLRKRVNLYGPIKQAYFQPFLFVYGTIGDSIDTENNLHHARIQSYNWWLRANGFVEIIPDTEITEREIKDYNLILFGNEEANSIIKKINRRLPIHFKEGKIAIGKEIIDESDLCMIEIYPNPLNQEKFVLIYSATTKKAQKYLGLFSPLYSGSGLPDFIIWGESASIYGWAGVVSLGFFNKDWQIDKDLMYVK